MASYIVLCRYTQRGVEHIKDSYARAQVTKDDAKAKGAELKEIFLVMGRYDLVLVYEAPDDETMAKVSLTLGGRGNVATETMRAFNEAEYKKICAGV
jgi:uncharacterized protein with GYD domain